MVITIIAILAAMLLPALAKAKDKAWEVQCVYNLRVFNMAQVQYWADFNEYFPLHIGSWYRDDVLNQYIEDNSAYDCPAPVHPTGEMWGKNGHPPEGNSMENAKTGADNDFDYGYSRLFLLNPPCSTTAPADVGVCWACRRFKVKNPQATIMMSDSFAHYIQAVEEYPFTIKPQEASPRHRGQAYAFVLWVDSHMSPEEYYSIQFTPGWRDWN